MPTRIIHDSQQDKKAFIHDLRDTYERWLEDGDNLAELEQTRVTMVREMTTARREIES